MSARDFQIFKKHAYIQILQAEQQLHLELPQTHEEFLAVCWARWLPKNDLGKEPISTRFLELSNQRRADLAHQYQLLGEECLLQHSMGLNQNRWPTKTYYMEWGQCALHFAGQAHDPTDTTLTKMAKDFITLAKVMTQCVRPKSDLDQIFFLQPNFH